MGINVRFYPLHRLRCNASAVDGQAFNLYSEKFSRVYEFHEYLTPIVSMGMSQGQHLAVAPVDVEKVPPRLTYLNGCRIYVFVAIPVTSVIRTMVVEPY